MDKTKVTYNKKQQLNGRIRTYDTERDFSLSLGTNSKHRLITVYIAKVQTKF